METDVISMGDAYLRSALDAAKRPKNGLKDTLLNIRQYCYLVNSGAREPAQDLELVKELIAITEPRWYNHGHCPLREIHNIEYNKDERSASYDQQDC